MKRGRFRQSPPARPPGRPPAEVLREMARTLGRQIAIDEHRRQLAAQAAKEKEPS